MEVWKKQGSVKKRKTDAATAKEQNNRRGFSSSSKNDDYSDTNDIDQDQQDNLNIV